MKVGAVDIGTNSMRLLIVEDGEEVLRRVEVTGLGRGVDATGRLSDEAMARTVVILEEYGSAMDRHGITRRKAIATSASRDASNRDAFFDRSEAALGVRPVLISGDVEAALSFRGAVSGLEVAQPALVSDIGGGSTELVTADGSVSVDVGSVRLTERALSGRPATPEDLARARALVTPMLASANLGPCMTHIGVAGTWTSLAAISLGLESYDRRRVHLSTIGLPDLSAIVERLAQASIEETASIPSLDPKRAPVILAGAVIAEAVMTFSGLDQALVSEHDSLDAVAGELMALS